MAKLRVRVHRDDDLRNRQVEIWRGRKKLTVDYDYSPVGDTFEFRLDGRRELLPSVPELLQIVDAKRIDRIGTIELIELIDEITNIGTIGEITTIRDLTLRKPSFIVNPLFNQGFTNWEITTTAGEDPTIVSADYFNYVKFLQPTECWLTQEFAIPLEVDALDEFYIIVRSPNTGNVIRIDYVYTDQTSSLDAQTILVADTWEKKVLAPTAGKKIQTMEIHHADTYIECWFKGFWTVY